MDKDQTPDNQPAPPPPPPEPNHGASPHATPPPPPPPPEQYSGPAPSPYPGQPKSSGLAIASLVLGIIGLMSAWFLVGGFFGLIGLILGIISLVKKMGGRGLAIAGVITSTVAILIATTFIALVAFVAYSGIQQRAETSSQQATASQIVKKAEAYNAIMGEANRPQYPDYQTLVSQTEVPEAQLDAETLELLVDGSQYDASITHPVTYQGCPEGALISYWNSVYESVDNYEAGQPSLCDFMTPNAESITLNLRYQL